MRSSWLSCNFLLLRTQRKTRGYGVFPFILMITVGCSGSDPMWQNIDIKAVMYSNEALPSGLSSQNTVNSGSSGNALLVCKVRNRTGMRVYAKMQFRDEKGNTSDVEFLCSEFNQAKWTTFTKPVQISAEDLSKMRKGAEVKLEPVHIETK